jgi:hypothetical protein
MFAFQGAPAYSGVGPGPSSLPWDRRRGAHDHHGASSEWDYNDVSTHASAILARLRNGAMPCDGAWPADQVNVPKMG